MTDMGLYFYKATVEWSDGGSEDFNYCEYHTPAMWLLAIRNVAISTYGPCYACSVNFYKALAAG